MVYCVMMGDERYVTLAEECAAEHVVQRSRFLGIAHPADTREDAREWIARCDDAYPDATHCCWAYRVGFPDACEEYYSDAGEPSGSAGRPMLNALCRAEVWNVAVCVIRYFGGVKLGVRGLIEAYRTAVEATLAAGERVRRQPLSAVMMSVPYAIYEPLSRRIADEGGVVRDTMFAEDVTVYAALPRGRVEGFAADAAAAGAKVREPGGDA